MTRPGTRRRILGGDLEVTVTRCAWLVMLGLGSAGSLGARAQEAPTEPAAEAREASPAYFHARAGLGLGGELESSDFVLQLGLSLELDLFRYVGLGVSGGTLRVKDEGTSFLPDFHVDLYGFWPVTEDLSLLLSFGAGFLPEPDDPILVGAIGARYWLNPWLFLQLALPVRGRPVRAECPAGGECIDPPVIMLVELSVGLTLPGRE